MFTKFLRSTVVVLCFSIGIDDSAYASLSEGTYGAGVKSIKYQDQVDDQGVVTTTFTPNDIDLPPVKGVSGSRIEIFALHIHLHCKSSGFYDLIRDTAGKNAETRNFSFKCQENPVISKGNKLWSVKEENKNACTKAARSKSAIIKDLCELYEKAGQK